MNRAALLGLQGSESDGMSWREERHAVSISIPDALRQEAETLAEKSGTTVEMPLQFRRMWRTGRLWARWSARRSWVL